jgi:hypothetical protein
MNRFETECRRLIDGLVRELAALADDLAQNEIRAARAAQKAAERAAPKVSPRLARALERAEERRRLAAERRAQKLAQRAARRTAVGDGQPTPSARTRVRPAAAPAEILPPPLFVHKRSRDGSIQKLERPAGEPAPAAAVPS